MIARRDECEAPFFGAKNQADLHAGPAFEIALAEAANTETRMKMRLPKTIADGGDGSGDIAPSRLRELSSISAEAF